MYFTEIFGYTIQKCQDCITLYSLHSPLSQFPNKTYVWHHIYGEIFLFYRQYSTFYALSLSLGNVSKYFFAVTDL